MTSTCGGELAACQGDSGCAGIITCIQGCSNATCQQGCLTKASSGAQAKFMAINSCISDQCISGGSTGPVCGNGSCETGETKSSCPTDCGGSTGTPAGCDPSPPSGQKFGCGGCACEACVCAADAWCCESGWDGQCATGCQKCNPGYCPGGGGGGAGGCGALLQCLGACSPGDDPCLQGCAGSASQDAIALYQAAATCVQNKCKTQCGGSDQAACASCQQQNCSNEILACQND